MHGAGRAPNLSVMGMLPYWLLFLIFAAGAVRYGIAAPAAESRPVRLRESQSSYWWEHHGRSARLLPFLAAVPALMIGLRYDVGTDWGAYVHIFNEISQYGLAFALTRIDPGYGILNWAAAKVGASFWTVNLACGLLIMFGVTRFARAQPNPWLVIAVAIPYFVIGVGMGYSRQAVAIALGMGGLAALSQGSSFTRFLLWIVAAALFHRTAVILIPIVGITYARNTVHLAVIGLVGAAVGYYMLSLGQGLEQLHRAYVSQVYVAGGAGIRLGMNLIPALVYLAWSRRFTADETERKIWRSFAILAVFSFIGYFFLESNVALDRMSLYIIPLQLFVFSRLPNALSNSTRPSNLLLVLVIFYSSAVQTVWLFFSNNAEYWLPYRLYPI